MRPLAVVAALWALFAGRATAEPIQISDVVFLPPRFYVGDRAEARLTLVSAGEFSIEAPTTLPSKRWLSVDEVVVSRVNDRSATVRIHFTSYLPGTQALPEIECGDVLLRDIKISTSSVIESGEGVDPMPPRPQFVLPGTWSITAAVAFGIVAVPLGLLLGIRALLGAGRRYRAFTLRKMPVGRFRRRLTRLGRTLQHMNVREFFIHVSEAFKRYLQERLGVPALGSTTQELSATVEQLLPEEVARRALEMLRLSDEVKFAGKPFRRENMRWVLRNLEETVADVEEALGVDV